MILYYNLMGPPSYVRPVVDRNFIMRRIPVVVISHILYANRHAWLSGKWSRSSFALKNRTERRKYAEEWMCYKGNV